MMRYSADLAVIAGSRPRTTTHWQEVQDLCASRFESLGFTVERHAYPSGVNVIGTREGTVLPEQRIMVSAHYDSTADCAGADDNGTGVAGVLEAARVLSATPHDRTLMVACWDEEERGPVGSTAFVEREVMAGTAAQYLASFVFEMIGYKSDAPDSQQVDPALTAIYREQTQQIEANDNRGDFILLVHDDLAAGFVFALETAAASVSLPTIALPVGSDVKSSTAFNGLRRSDHAPFWDADVPAIQITDTANYRNPHYHCSGGPDVIEDLDMDFATRVVRATVGAIDANLVAPTR